MICNIRSYSRRSQACCLLATFLLMVLILGYYRYDQILQTIPSSSVLQGNTEVQNGIKQVYNLLQQRLSLTARNITSDQKPKATIGNPRSITTIGIPKIMHQIWTTDVVPNEFVENVKGLVKLNPPPEWKYYFWPLDVGRKLIEREYPAVLPFFEASGNLQRSDILRLLIIHHFGGVYYDLDTVGVKPLKPFMENRTCSLVTDPPEHVIAKDMIVHVDLINNNALFCQAGHPFYTAAINLLAKQPLTCQRTIQCAGPFFLSHLHYEMRKVKENHDFLPKIENYQLFEDKIATGSLNNPNRVCSGQEYLGGEIWRREMCDEWIRRGKSTRKISDLAYTYHTWFHTLTNKVHTDPKNMIKNIVPHVLIYE